jgi:hypothetical protein
MLVVLGLSVPAPGASKSKLEESLLPLRVDCAVHTFEMVIIMPKPAK